MKQNPAHIYREIAKRIVERTKANIVKAIERKEPDLYFSLEGDIMEALKYADKLGAAREYERMATVMREFDEKDGETNQ